MKYLVIDVGGSSISPQQQWLQATQFIADQFGND